MMAGQSDSRGTELKENAAARLAARENHPGARRGRAGRSRRALCRSDDGGAGGGRPARPHRASRDRLRGWWIRPARAVLHSDVDLLIVSTAPSEEREEAFVKAVLQPLWDLRLELGQHVREFADFADPISAIRNSSSACSIA
jgi:hypothetical protein